MYATLTRTYINVPPMKPREFCRIWLRADSEREAERGYRADCARLLATTLGLKEATIAGRWGEGIDFPKMPAQYETALANAHTLLLMVNAANQNPGLSRVVNECLKSRNKV